MRITEDEDTFDTGAGWDGPDYHGGCYGIVFDDRRDGDDYCVPCFMKVDATPDRAFYGWSYWDILENSKKFIKRVEETGDNTHDTSKDGPIFSDLALFIKEPQNPQDKLYFEDQWLPKCRVFCSKKYDTSKIYATEYPKSLGDQLDLELAALGITFQDYFEKLDKLCNKIYGMDMPKPESNWVYPF